MDIKCATITSGAQLGRENANPLTILTTTAKQKKMEIEDSAIMGNAYACVSLQLLVLYNQIYFYRYRLYKFLKLSN